MVLIIAFYDQVLDFLIQPYVELCERKPPDFCDPTLNTFSPTEGLATRLRVGMYGGIIARAARPAVADLAVHRSGAARQGEEVRDSVRPVVDRAVRCRRRARLPARVGQALEFLIAWSGSDVNQIFPVTST